LIIEDEHSRVSLDADLRQELYSAIGSARPLSPAPASTSYEQPKCFGKNNPDIFDCENCGDREYCIDITEASRAAADAAVKERDQQIIAAFDKEDADGFANMVRAKEIVKSLRRAPQQEQKPKIVFHPKENNWHRGR
jgi:hypothetical protein